MIGAVPAFLWWLCTMSWAGWFRSRYERMVAARGAGWGSLPLVAFSSALFWAAAPMLAWRAGSDFGHMLAWLMLASGFHLSFTQLGHTPRNALLGDPAVQRRSRLHTG